MELNTAHINLTLQDKQEVAFLSPANEILYGGAAGGGKLLDLMTMVPTPSGWSYLHAIRVGDEVFDEMGKVCRVTGLSPIDYNPESYRIRFDDGTEFLACADHQWVTFSASELAGLTRLSDAWRENRKSKRPSRAKGNKSEAFRKSISKRNATRGYTLKSAPSGTVRATREIFNTLRLPSGRANHAIPVCRALDLPEAVLPLDPYVLGLWLGDGSKNQPAITTADKQILEEIEKAGFEVSKWKAKYLYGIKGLTKFLKQCGVFGNKRIPAQYLRASREQRLSLLQGLMDTDGYACKAGSVEFTNTNHDLVIGVYELITSLGWKAHVCSGRAKLNGEDCGPKWDIKWTPDDYVFRLQRKRSRQKLSTSRRTKFRYIERCEPVPSVPMRCLAVDSPSRQFLIGRSFVPTHNSHLMRVCAIYWCLRVANFQAYFFRRHYEDLIKNHMGGPNGFRMMLAPLVECGDVTIVEKEIRFNRNGSKIFLCHCNDEDDVYQYWGAEIHAFFPDELTHFTEQMYRFLRGRCRAVGLNVPEDLKGKFPCIMAGSNPGNIGHQWVKSMFIDPAEPYEVWRVPKEEGGTLRQFIPATLEDNPKLMEEDPEYESKLLGLGSEEYVKAIRWGSWDVLEGAFFTEFDRRKHVIPAFSVPKQWKRFRSFDWGFAKPFCIHWWAIADGEALIADDGTAIKIPRNALVCYREWYGCSKPNVGLRMTPELIAAGVKQREKGESFSYSVADPSIFKQDGGPSIGERLASYGVVFRGGDNSRVSGWSEVRARMSAVDGPMIYFFQSCVHTIRTIPIMQYDDVRQEDLDTDHEDHAVDSIRYACMSRPFLSKRKKKKTAQKMTLDELVKFNKEWKRREFRKKANFY